MRQTGPPVLSLGDTVWKNAQAITLLTSALFPTLLHLQSKTNSGKAKVTIDTCNAPSSLSFTSTPPECFCQWIFYHYLIFYSSSRSLKHTVGCYRIEFNTRFLFVTWNLLLVSMEYLGAKDSRCSTEHHITVFIWISWRNISRDFKTFYGKYWAFYWNLRLYLLTADLAIW